MEWITDTKTVATIFAVVGLAAAICLMLSSERKIATQILGSLFVISISFSADDTVVYTIAVFVIATLVTELHFLEKIAALIWNRKEYWKYLSGNASKKEVEEKTRSEIEANLINNDAEGPDEVEAIDKTNHEPEGISETEDDVDPKDSQQLVAKALQFERAVLDNLNSNQLPFDFLNFRKEVRMTSGSDGYIIDGIIDAGGVHYLLEIKNIKRPSSLINAVDQIQKYKIAYERYLWERNICGTVQPLIIVPNEVNIGSQFRGVPIVKYDQSKNIFSNLKVIYSDYDTSKLGQSNIYTLKQLLIKFLTEHSNWAFSPLRIQTWGAKQIEYENFGLYSTSEIRNELDILLINGDVIERKSRKGNKLYRKALTKTST